jgi:2-oxoglutarate ferredoxin oxidoreductase subunit delta
MAEITIVERGCRGCTLCVDVCPVEVFDYDQERELATVARPDDCIGCLSCVYVCPSRCVEVSGVEVLRPFHRIEGHAGLIERFLQEEVAGETLTDGDLDEAHRDVAARLVALADAVVETMGRGHKAVGRRAGAVAAIHMPEIYEDRSLTAVLARLEEEIGEGFNLTTSASDNQIDLRFAPCGLCRVVEEAGQTVGEAVLCEIFHEYLAGLLSEYSGTTYRFELPQVGQTCEMRLVPAR